MLKEPFLQPFENITITMTEGTNGGMLNMDRVGVKADNKFKYPQGPDSIMLDKDRMYSPIILDDTTGMGKLPVASGDDAKIVIGVITESFTQPGAATRVMLEGIVPMLCSDTNLKTGNTVMVDASAITDKQGPVRVKKAATGKYAFGICLQGFDDTTDPKPTADAPIYVPVMIGTTGGWE